LETCSLNSGFVHAGLEVVSDFAFGIAAADPAFGGLVEDAPQQPLVVVSEFAIDVPRSLVGGTRVLF
jgi:hypothetical protein